MRSLKTATLPARTHGEAAPAFISAGDMMPSNENFGVLTLSHPLPQRVLVACNGYELVMDSVGTFWRATRPIGHLRTTIEKAFTP